MKYFNALAVTLFGLMLWQALVWLTGAPPFILPSPQRVAMAMFSSRALIAEHALVTGAEVVLGLLIGTGLGMVTAVQLALSPLVRRLVLPLLIFTQAVPVFALAPILTLWFGYGMASKVVMAIFIIYFPVTSSFYDGLSRTNHGWLDLARTMGATRGRIVRHIRIPAALPSLGTGLRLAAVYAPIGAVIGEWVGASKGLGYLMLFANGRAKTDLMFASLIVLAVMAMTLHQLVGLLARRLEDYARPGVARMG